MLKLRRGSVVAIDFADERIAHMTVRVGDEQRAAIAYTALTGPVETGDEVVVNVEAQDLGLGSGGFDIVGANLTRGVGGGGALDAHVMKLNYTPIQHPVAPLEQGLELLPERLDLRVGVLALHGQLPSAAFALAETAPELRVGYLQSAGGALPGALSNVVAELLERGMLADHVTVAPCFGGRHEAITLEGGLHGAAERLGWDVALAGPGPGILGSASALGHGGIAALHSAHAALSLGCDVVLAPRISSGDRRERHRGLSHHTRTVLALLLGAVGVALPEGVSPSSRAALEQSVASGTGHRAIETALGDLPERYLRSGLPTETMGRPLDGERDFLLAGLAAGAALAARSAGTSPE